MCDSNDHNHPRGSALHRLLDGFDAFHQEYFQADDSLYEDLVNRGQTPKVMVVGCSDSRSDPAIITRAEPGDLFVVRNVAALVPPYIKDGYPHGTAAALEFGVRQLKVEHIIILGHSLCGGMNLLSETSNGDDTPLEFVKDWVDIAAEAREAIAKLDKETSPAARARAIEQQGIRVSLQNLSTYPWIADRVTQGKVSTHGWYFDFTHGALYACDPETGQFAPLDPAREERRAAID